MHVTVWHRWSSCGGVTLVKWELGIVSCVGLGFRQGRGGEPEVLRSIEPHLLAPIFHEDLPQPWRVQALDRLRSLNAPASPHTRS